MASFLCTAVFAQDFIFVSNRLRADPDLRTDGAPAYQSELFRYSDGSEIRLTYTAGQREWDPAPSPSGRFVAYFAQDNPPILAELTPPYLWNWYLRILDLDSGLLVEDWLLPDAVGTLRMAGGFSIDWYPDETALLVQIQNQSHEPYIAVFDVGQDVPQILTRGVGASLDPVRGWIATTIDGYATVFDPRSGNSYPLAMGDALGWLDDQVLIGSNGSLTVVDPVTAVQTPVHEGSDFYSQFSLSPSHTRYAWVHSPSGESGARISVTDADFNLQLEWTHSSFITDLSWLNEQSLLITSMVGDTLRISELRLSDETEFPLVSSHRDDYTPKLLPARNGDTGAE